VERAQGVGAQSGLYTRYLGSGSLEEQVKSKSTMVGAEATVTAGWSDCDG
jgi:hypothetical protein